MTTTAATAPAKPRYHLFEVTGLELEYAVVDRSLRPQCLVEPAFRVLAGRPTSDVDFEHIGFSNELAAHVFEVKNLLPDADLAVAERNLVDGVRRFAAVLRDQFDGARLLPTAMHPFMRPNETQLWQRSGRAIYETYARLFSIQEHGWLNVQSCQVNLPFGADEAETVCLHNAIACLLPYLPALAASSPFVEGRLGPNACNRMAFYASNQRRVPEIAGRIVPEYMTSFAQYRSDVFERIYTALDKIEGAERIRHEFVNSRGAILRFDREAIEVRVIDLQECVKMDVAIATFVRLAARALTQALQAGRLVLPDHAILVEDYDACVARGRMARVFAPHLMTGSRAARWDRVCGNHPALPAGDGGARCVAGRSCVLAARRDANPKRQPGRAHSFCGRAAAWGRARSTMRYSPSMVSWPIAWSATNRILRTPSDRSYRPCMSDRHSLISCEHASNRIPSRLADLGLSSARLRQHIAWDPGAGSIARMLARRLGCPCHQGRWSRLVVDLNRSLGHEKLMAAETFGVRVPGNESLAPREIERRVRTYWRPYRDAATADVRRIIARTGRCVHWSIHSFTPVVDGIVRPVDVGLLYDPRRRRERDLAHRLRPLIAAHGLRVRMNAPYRGTSDGFTTQLRGVLPESRYLAFEIETNQALLQSPAAVRRMAQILSEAVAEISSGGAAARRALR